MLKILPISNKIKLQEYCTTTGLSCEYGYEITERGESLGYCLFDIIENKGVVRYISVTDKLLFDGIVRATMSYLLENKIDTLKFDDTVDQDLLTKCLFVTDTTNTIHSIEQFFSKKCSG